MGDTLEREGRVVVDDAVDVAVTAGEEAGPAGGTQGVDDEGALEADAVGRQAVEVGRLQPGEAALLALLALDDAQGVPALVVAVDEDEVGPGLGRAQGAGCGQDRSQAQDATVHGDTLTSAR